MGNRLAVASGHLDEAATGRSGIVQLGVSDHLHPLHDRADLRIAHVLARVALLERDSAVHQRRGDQVLAVDVGHAAVADDARGVFGQPDDDALDVVGTQVMLATKRQQRIERSLVGVAHREGLDARLRDKEPGAHPGHHFLGARVGGERLQRVVPARQHVADGSAAALHHDGGRDAVASTHPANVECLLDVLVVLYPAPEAGDLLGAVGDCVAHPLLTEPRQGRRRGHAAHGRDGTFDGSVALANGIVAEGDDEATSDVVAEHDRPEQLQPGPLLLFRHRQGSRHDPCARMRLGQRIDIVRLVGVREHPVRQRCVDRGRLDVRAEHGGLLHAALRTDEADGRFPGSEPCARHDRSQRIQDAVLPVAHRHGWEVLLTGRHHVERQLSGEIVHCAGRRLRRHHRRCVARPTRRQHRTCEDHTRALHQIASRQHRGPSDCAKSLPARPGVAVTSARRCFSAARAGSSCRSRRSKRPRCVPCAPSRSPAR